MYLSFIEDQKETLSRKLDELENIEMNAARELESISDELRDLMLEKLADLISEVISDMPDDIDAYQEDEYTMEMQEAFTDFVRGEI